MVSRFLVRKYLADPLFPPVQLHRYGSDTVQVFSCPVFLRHLPESLPPGKGILRDPQFSQQPIRPRPVNRLLRRFQIVGKTAPNIILQADVRLDQSSPDRVQVNVMAYRVQTISSRDSVLPDTQLTAASP
jgi:hypothetical protein